MTKTGGYIEVTVRFFEEEDQWAAECVELGTATCADTFEEAKTAINAMVLLHLNALADADMCRDFLKKHGVKFHKGEANKPAKRRSDLKVWPGELASRTRIPFPTFRSPRRKALAL